MRVFDDAIGSLHERLENIENKINQHKEIKGFRKDGDKPKIQQRIAKRIQDELNRRNISG